MKRLAVRIVLALGLLVPTATAVTTPTAHAGDYYYSTTACRPDVEWYSSASWVAYRRVGTSTPYYVYKNWPGYPGEIEMNAYARHNWQCGPLGMPTGQMHWQQPGWYMGTFEGGSLWYSEMGYWVICYNGGGCYYA